MIANIVLFSQSENGGEGSLQVQKKKEAGQKKIPKALPAGIKAPAKPKTVLVNKMKVVRFISVNINEGAVETLVKQSSRERAKKPRGTFEKIAN
jgi:hypothetical protein